MKNIRIALLMCVICLFLDNCAVQENRQAALTPVSVRLKWVNQAQFAGIYVAKEKGFYGNEGLNVSIIPFSYQNTPLDMVADGQADFGITGADELLLARFKGLKVKAIAIIFKNNPQCIFIKKSSNITRPQELIGKSIGLDNSKNGNVLYKIMMKILDINRSELNEIFVGYDGKELYEDKVDAYIGYSINPPYPPNESYADIGINKIMMADYGADVYADVIFTSEKIINEDPELVKKFLKASIEGWQYTIRNEEEAVNITLIYAEKQDKEFQQVMLRESLPLINTGNSYLGMMGKEKWENTKKALVSSDLLADIVSVDDAYTNQFIEGIYKK
jgi:NitT/TauT family transport system substrate-binding protein